ncbi:MAG TPA: cell wall hydrolase [Rhizomicrobium sp.]|nr:cell wall hydrolase [Rhizomicrobium sp.]
MSNITKQTLARADRAVAVAVFLVMATVGTAAAYNPYADDILARATPTVSQDLAPAAQPMQALAAAPEPAELAMVKMTAEQDCLAEAMYFEARGQGTRGEEAVAEVIFNRMRDPNYPGTICGVVHQGCQFSYVCQGRRRTHEAAAWADSRLLAAEIMAGYRPLGDETGGATSYHADYVDPGWDGMVETGRVGNHIFYRRAPRHVAPAPTLVESDHA